MYAEYSNPSVRIKTNRVGPKRTDLFVEGYCCIASRSNQLSVAFLFLLCSALFLGVQQQCEFGRLLYTWKNERTILPNGCFLMTQAENFCQRFAQVRGRGSPAGTLLSERRNYGRQARAHQVFVTFTLFLCYSHFLVSLNSYVDFFFFLFLIEIRGCLSSNGESRQIAFVGFRTEQEGQEAMRLLQQILHCYLPDFLWGSFCDFPIWRSVRKGC